MEIKLIKNKKNYTVALKRIDELFEAEPGTPEGDELDLLVTLVDKYEEENYSIPEPHPIEAIKFMMEQMEIKPKDLAVILKSQSRVSEILNKKRPLNLRMVQLLHEHLRIPAEILIRDYELSA